MKITIEACADDGYGYRSNEKVELTEEKLIELAEKIIKERFVQTDLVTVKGFEIKITEL